jgi:hypothetical protein
VTERKVYLGDSVYAEPDPYGAIILTTENGAGPSNRIVLEPEVLRALLIFSRTPRQPVCALCRGTGIQTLEDPQGAKYPARCPRGCTPAEEET